MFHGFNMNIKKMNRKNSSIQILKKYVLAHFPEATDLEDNNLILFINLKICIKIAAQ